MSRKPTGRETMLQKEAPMLSLSNAVLLLVLVLGTAVPAAAEVWFLPEVFPNHHLAATHKLAGVESVGSGRPVFWLPTLESSYWSSGNWTRTLTDARERPCCWDLNQWNSDGDRGRGGYGGHVGLDTYDIWVSSPQVTPTFPLSVDLASLPVTRLLPGGTGMGLRVHRPSDTVVGYLDRSGACCAPEPVVIQAGPVLIKLSRDFTILSGRPVIKMEGWGVDEAGRRTSRGEAFYFCLECLLVEDAPAGGPVRWEVTDLEGYVVQQWTFSRWVPRTAQDVVDTMRPELDRLRREVKGLQADNAVLRDELAACAP